MESLMRYRYVIGILLSAGVLMAGVSCSPAPDEGQPENATQQQNAAQQKNAAEHGGAGNPGTSTAKGAIVGRTTVIGNVYSHPEIDMTCDPACAALNASAPDVIPKKPIKSAEKIKAAAKVNNLYK